MPMELIPMKKMRSQAIIIMDNICPYCCKKSFSDEYALKHNATKCEITSSSAPPRKSSRETSCQPDPAVLN